MKTLALIVAAIGAFMMYVGTTREDYGPSRKWQWIALSGFVGLCLGAILWYL